MNNGECKYPGGVTKALYCQALLNEYSENKQYPDISKDNKGLFISDTMNAIITLVTYFPDRRNENILLLSELNKISEEKYNNINNIQVTEKDIFDELFESLRYPEKVIDDTDEDNIPLDPKIQLQYAAFLKEITNRCINDIVKANLSKKLSFKENIAEEFIISDTFLVNVSRKTDTTDKKPQEGSKQLTMLFDVRRKTNAIANMSRAATQSSFQGKKRDIGETISENESIPTQANEKKLKKAEFKES